VISLSRAQAPAAAAEGAEAEPGKSPSHQLRCRPGKFALPEAEEAEVAEVEVQRQPVPVAAEYHQTSIRRKA
jgi:hypothetical protein